MSPNCWLLHIFLVDNFGDSPTFISLPPYRCEITYFVLLQIMYIKLKVILCLVLHFCYSYCVLGTILSARDIGWTDWTGSLLPGSSHSNVKLNGFGVMKDSHQKGALETLLVTQVRPDLSEEKTLVQWPEGDGVRMP